MGCDPAKDSPHAGASFENQDGPSTAAAPPSVAPYAGAWIEIFLAIRFLLYRLVAPYAGAWIEIIHIYGMFFHRFVAPSAGGWFYFI